MAHRIHPDARLTPRQREELHQDTALGVKEACEKYRVTAHTIYKWRRGTDFDDRSHAPRHPRLVLSPFERHVICEVRKSTGFSLDDLVDALQPHIPHIGKGNVYRYWRVRS